MHIYRAQAYFQRMASREKLCDIYPDDEMLQMALPVLVPGFEYGKVLHLTVGELRALITQELPRGEAQALGAKGVAQ